MPRVLVTPHLLFEQPGPYRDELLQAGLDVVYPPGGRSLMEPAALAAALVGVDAVLAGMEPFNRQVLAGARLRAIARMGVGYDAIDVPAATAQGVPVTITPGTNEVSVAEHALALMLGVMRGFPGRQREVEQGNWRRKSLPRLAGKVLGLVGLGRIGKAMVPRAQGLGLRVIACDPLADRQFTSAHGVALVTWDELLTQADIISLHAPATPVTDRMINAESLARMKPRAVLINTARGSLVDEPALAAALASGHLLGAGLDAFTVEPLPLDSPLLRVDNALLAPHMGGLDEESEVAMSHLAAKCLGQLYRGQWPAGCVVNDELRSGWRW